MGGMGGLGGNTFPIGRKKRQIDQSVASSSSTSPAPVPPPDPEHQSDVVDEIIRTTVTATGQAETQAMNITIRQVVPGKVI